LKKNEYIIGNYRKELTGNNSIEHFE